MNTHRLLMGICLLLAVTPALGADKPASRVAVNVIYREFSANRQHYVDVFPAVGELGSYARVYSRNAAAPLWFVRGYARGAALADNGEYLLLFGNPDEGKNDAVLLTLYHRKEKVAEYRVEDLAGKKGTALRLAQVEGFRETGKVFRVVLSDATVVDVDVTTGKVSSRTEGKPPEKGGEGHVHSDGYKAAVQARAAATTFNILACRLYVKIVEGGQGNMVFCPANVATNLALILPGARGKTAQELNRQLFGEEAPDVNTVITRLTLLYEQLGVGDVEALLADVRGSLAALKVTPRTNEGLKVDEVPQGPLVGVLKPGDIIQSAGGKQTTETAHLLGGVDLGGDVLELRVARPGAKEPVAVRIPMRPAFPLNAAIGVAISKDLELRPEFKDAVARFRPNILRQMDFTKPEAAAAELNASVQRATGGKIRDLFNATDLRTDGELVLINALSLSVPWSGEKFKRSEKPGRFLVDDKREVNVPVMTQTGSYRLVSDPNFELLELPFAGDRLTLLVLLPDPTQSLGHIERQLKDGLAGWLDKLDRSRRQDLNVVMPPFTVDGGRLKLERMLAELVFPSAFSEKDADFSGVTGSKPLRLGQVSHRAYLRVDENGAEGAAATATTFVPRSETTRFAVDRPFLFLVRDRGTGSVLFFGRVTDPTRGG